MRLNPNEQGSKFQFHNASQFALKNESAIAKRQAQMVQRVERVIAEKAGQSLNQPAYKLDDSLKAMLRQMHTEDTKEEMQENVDPMETALLENSADALADGEESTYIPAQKVDLADAGTPTVALQDVEGMEELIKIVGGLKRPDDYKPMFTFDTSTTLDWDKIKIAREKSDAMPIMDIGYSPYMDFTSDAYGTRHVNFDMMALKATNDKYNNGFSVISARYAQMREYAEAIDGSKYGEVEKQSLLSELDNAMNAAIATLFVDTKTWQQMTNGESNAFVGAANRFEEMYAMINSKVGIDFDEKTRDFLLEGLKETFKKTVEQFSQRQGFNVYVRRIDDEKRYEAEYLKAEKQMKTMKEKIAEAMKMIDWNSANSIKASLTKAYSMF